jgi:hypothetical protein
MALTMVGAIVLATNIYCPPVPMPSKSLSLPYSSSLSQSFSFSHSLSRMLSQINYIYIIVWAATWPKVRAESFSACDRSIIRVFMGYVLGCEWVSGQTMHITNPSQSHSAITTHCWKNMITFWTKRTRGMENPYTFIRLNIECDWIWLNMWIVRVSSLFFYNPCVESQLCIVNRDYAIVTKQQWVDQTNKFCSTF